MFIINICKIYHMIILTPKDAYKKCKNENRKILELEYIIAKEASYAYLYAFRVIRNRFYIGEKKISEDAEISYFYARDVVKNVFPISHGTIFYSDWKEKYLLFLNSINFDFENIKEWLI
jgi:hypothetical protein